MISEWAEWAFGMVPLSEDEKTNEQKLSKVPILHIIQESCSVISLGRIGH